MGAWQGVNWTVVAIHVLLAGSDLFNPGAIVFYIHPLAAHQVHLVQWCAKATPGAASTIEVDAPAGLDADFRHTQTAAAHLLYPDIGCCCTTRGGTDGVAGTLAVQSPHTTLMYLRARS